MICGIRDYNGKPCILPKGHICKHEDNNGEYNKGIEFYGGYITSVSGKIISFEYMTNIDGEIVETIPRG